MNKKEFQKLPNGTILIYDPDGLQFVEVKVSKNCTRYLTDAHYSHNGDVWELSKVYKNSTTMTQGLVVAPKWIQKLFEVK